MVLQLLLATRPEAKVYQKFSNAGGKGWGKSELFLFFIFLLRFFMLSGHMRDEIGKTCDEFSYELKKFSVIILCLTEDVSLKCWRNNDKIVDNILSKTRGNCGYSGKLLA